MAPPLSAATSSPATLRRRSLLLVLLAVLPALALVGVSAVRNRDALADQVERNAIRIARLAASRHEAAIEGARQFLTALSRAPEMRSGEPDRCRPLVRDLLARFPNYLNIGAAELPGGAVTCSAVPLESPVNVSDRAYFRRAAETGAFAVGDYLIGRVTGQPSIAFGVPVLGDDGLPHSIAFAALSLRVFDAVSAVAELPSGSAIIVLDGEGTILSRTPDQVGGIGEKLPDAALVEAAGSRRQGAVEVAGRDGVRRLYGFTRLDGGGDVSVAVGISTQAAFAEVDATFRFGVIGLAVVGALALMAAWYFGTAFVVRPVTAALTGEREAVQRLEEVDQMRTDFVSMVSHELRNPLATIRGFGQLLLERPEAFSPEQLQQAYEVIVRQVDRMASLVDNVLDVSRLESDTFSFAFIPYDPNQLLEECAQEMRASWPEHDIRLEFAGAIPSASGDADRLKQVILNLLSNACRYSPEGSTVAVRCRTERDVVRVDVADSGPGIAPEHQILLFQRFARLRTPDTQRVRGTGLGLYISRRIVEAHGGRIWVDSQPGRGATFSLEIPLAPPRATG